MSSKFLGIVSKSSQNGVNESRVVRETDLKKHQKHEGHEGERSDRSEEGNEGESEGRRGAAAPGTILKKRTTEKKKPRIAQEAAENYNSIHGDSRGESACSRKEKGRIYFHLVKKKAWLKPTWPKFTKHAKNQSEGKKKVGPDYQLQDLNMTGCQTIGSRTIRKGGGCVT